MDTSIMLRKSNDFVTSKFRSTVIENKIMAISLSRIEETAMGMDSSPVLEARLYPGELKQLLGSPTNIYNTLKKVSKTIVGHSMLIEDGKGNFRSFAIVTNADYENGEFIIRFNDALRPHIIGLKSNYTTLELSVMTGLTSNSSIRIYELLKKEVYKSDPNVDGGRVVVTYNLNEFRFMIGLADIEEQNVKNAIARMGNIVDWDYLFENVVVNKSYADVRNLKKKILEPAKEELQNLANIRFEYELVRLRGNKYSQIIFYIYPNNPIFDAEKLIEKKSRIIDSHFVQTEYPKIQYEKLFEDFAGHNRLTEDDINLLLRKANFNEQLVRTAIQQADSKGDIPHYMGWIIKCIEHGGYSDIHVANGSSEAAESNEQLMSAVHSDSIQNKVWIKTKEKPDFEEFLKYIGMSCEVFEADFPEIRERMEMYTDWRKANMD